MGIFFRRLGGFYQYRFLMQQLVTKDIKLKYRRSFLGYLWSILNPLMIMVIMVIVFSNMFRSDIENFPVYLIIGQTLFNFMSESTNQAITSITGNAALLKKTYVPKYVFTVSKVTSSFVNTLFALGALVIVFIVCRVTPNIYYLLIPVILLQEYIFCLGLGMLLAQSSVFFRDIQYIYNAIITAWMYLTPLFYPITLLPDKLRQIVMALNPMYFYVAEFRQIVLEGRMPDPYLIIAGTGAAIFVLVIGTWAFLKTQDKFILYI
ncbi:ABC transporter permease [Clostridium sp. AM58-1XD]|uniref:ABC transporter permease n=1 Tax=Clostridium sp. AM58-1XD TaxID=2292307 RepID=UPI000E502748|nr:ABC transporter permease [Clostridium sp. AM58-1XD]RGY96551.1 ABC transporter permease [Clostridium sp. AM58-1XD]